MVVLINEWIDRLVETTKSIDKRKGSNEDFEDSEEEMTSSKTMRMIFDL